MRAFILADFRGGGSGSTENREANPALLGENPDCPVGTPEKSSVEGGAKGAAGVAAEVEEAAVLEELVNQTWEMSRTFLFPLLALLSRIHSIDDFKEIFVNARTRNLVFALMEGKGINLKGNNYSHIVRIMSSILDGNRDVVTTIREIYAAADARKVRSLIEKHFVPSASEKTKNAEIPTPVTLVDEMLAAVPVEFWKSPRKVFEPCCGKGNFVLGIFDKFFEGLVELIPDCVERCRIIVEECLYFADLTDMNVFITTEILKCHARAKGGFEEAEYAFNAHTGDTLAMEPLTVWKIEKFDAVIGNPPYQSNVSSNGTLWDKFVVKGLNNLNKNGYLVFVHPSGWRNISGKFKYLQKELLSRELQYLEIHNEKDGVKTFNSETRYDWYVLKNTKVSYTNTKIKFQDGLISTINIVGVEFIPNGKYDKIMSMIAREGEERVSIMHSESIYEIRKKWMSNILGNEHKYPCVYTVNSKSMITYKYSSKKHGHFDIPKFIWSNGRISSIGSYVDTNGEYGLTQFAYAIIDEPINLPNIKIAFDSKDFRNLMELCAVGQLTVNHKVVGMFKKDFWKEFV